MNYVIAILSLVITLFFTYNFGAIIKKIKSGKQVNKLSLLATSSLIFHFLSLFLYFIFKCGILVLISEAYTLICLTYLLKKK